jgi:predicted RNA methylase
VRFTGDLIGDLAAETGRTNLTEGIEGPSATDSAESDSSEMEVGKASVREDVL